MGRDEDIQIKEALGGLVVAFSEVELRLQQLIWGLLGVDDHAGSIVTSALSSRMAARVAQQLWEAKQMPAFDLGADAQEIYGAATAVEWLWRELPQAEEARNLLLHSWWPDSSEPHWWPHVAAPFEEEGAVLRWKAPARSGQLQAVKVDIEEVNEAAKHCYEVAVGLATMAGAAKARA